MTRSRRHFGAPRGTLAAVALIAALNTASPARAQIECVLIAQTPIAELMVRYGDDYLMANAFLTVLTAGGSSLPYVDPLIAGQIAIDLRNGNYISAANRAYYWGEGKAISWALGSTAGAFLTAVRLGEALGMRAWDWRHDVVFQRAYAPLANIDPENWPDSYGEFFRRYEARLAPMERQFDTLQNFLVVQIHGARWRRSGLTESQRIDMAYQSLRLHHLLESAFDAEGLQGADRTPERLEQIVSERLQRAVEAETTAQLRAAAERDCVSEPEPEPDIAARPDPPRPSWRDEADPLAAAEPEPDPEPDPPPAPEPPLAVAPPPAPEPEPEAPAGPLTVTLLTTERTGRDSTMFRVQVSNTSDAPVAGFRPAVQPERIPATGGHGTGFAFGEGARNLAPGESVTFGFIGSGDIGAVQLHLMAGGMVLGSQRFAVQHATETRDPLPAITLATLDIGGITVLPPNTVERRVTIPDGVVDELFFALTVQHFDPRRALSDQSTTTIRVVTPNGLDYTFSGPRTFGFPVWHPGTVRFEGSVRISPVSTPGTWIIHFSDGPYSSNLPGYAIAPGAEIQFRQSGYRE